MSLKEEEMVEKDYLEKCIEAIKEQIPIEMSIDECTNRFSIEQGRINFTHITTGEKYIISLLTQNNLLLDKLCTIMLVATGLDKSDIGEITKDDVEDMVGKSTMCGQCGKVVIPNDMGYCPNCKNDLKRQIAQEAINP
jgi:hypothetical protein